MGGAGKERDLQSSSSAPKAQGKFEDCWHKQCSATHADFKKRNNQICFYKDFPGHMILSSSAFGG